MNGLQSLALRYGAAELGWLLFAVLILLIVAAVLHDRLATHRSLQRWGKRHAVPIVRYAQIAVGVGLFTSAIKGTVLAPQLVTVEPVMNLLRMLEALAGLMLISNQMASIAALLMLLLQVLVLGVFGWVPALEHIYLIGLAALFLGTPPAAAPAPQALLALRVAVGLGLLSLGVTGKLLAADIALQFLAAQPVNFLQIGELVVSHRQFVLWAGGAEFLFGLLYLTGLLPRLNTLCFAAFLMAANGWLLLHESAAGSTGLTPSAPLLASAWILLIYGGGALRPQRQTLPAGDHLRLA